MPEKRLQRTREAYSTDRDTGDECDCPNGRLDVKTVREAYHAIMSALDGVYPTHVYPPRPVEPEEPTDETPWAI